MPVRTARSAAGPDVPSTSSRAEESLVRTYSAKGRRVRTDTSGRPQFAPASQAASSRIRCFPRDPALSAVRKNDPDPADPPTRPVRADRKPLTEQRVSRIDDPNSGYQSLRYCGVPSCSAIRSSRPRSSTGCCTTATSSRSAATAAGCARSAGRGCSKHRRSRKPQRQCRREQGLPRWVHRDLPRAPLRCS